MLRQGTISTWSDFVRELRSQLASFARNGGEGLRFLTETVTSPTLSAQFSQILQKYPNARWHRWQPVSRDNALAGSTLAFGAPLETRYHFEAADVVQALDADPFAWSPGRLRYMHDSPRVGGRRQDQSAASTRWRARPRCLGRPPTTASRWLHTPLSRSRQPWEFNRETHNGRRQVAYRPVGWTPSRPI